MKIKLGTHVIDKITGFAGIATARTEFMNGCIRIGVDSPVGDDGKLRDTEWFDENRLKGNGRKRTPPAGPGPAPPSRDYRGW